MSSFSVLLIEQNARAALDVADRCALLAMGQVVAGGAPQDFSDDDIAKPISISAWTLSR